MMNRTYAWIEWCSDKFDGLNVREKILLLAVMLVVVFSLWKPMVFDVLADARKTAHRDLEVLNTELHYLTTNLHKVSQEAVKHPIKALDQRVVLLEKENTLLEQKITKIASRLTSPKAMTNLLNKILESDVGLTVVGMKNLDEVLLFDFSKAAQLEQLVQQAPEAMAVYKHGLVMDFKGNYFAVLKFLEVLEALKQGMVWEELSYTVDQHPEAKVQLVVYTLSLDRRWVSG